MRFFSIQSFGCRVNQAEIFEWAEGLQAHGFQLEKDVFRSDLIIVNTCVLTVGAERDVRKFLKRISRQNPQAHLIVTGCGVDLMKNELEENSQVRLIIRNEDKSYLLPRVLSQENLQSEESQSGLELSPSKKKAFRARALIKIQDGCSQSCTFCLIPKVRGQSRSRPLNEILERMRELIDRGYREIVLAGIHLTSYGQENDSLPSLLGLLQEATRLEGLGRIRLSSLDPRAISDDLIDFIAGNEKICPHFHLSLQQAREKVLRLMGRKGSPADYERILNRLKEKSPYAALGADIIVGFPGEEEEDFAFLQDFIISSPLTYLHVFPYSPRPGTPAARWPQIPASKKKKRAEALRNLAHKKNLSFRQSLIGQVFPAIAIRPKNEAETEVLTANYVKVKVAGRLKEGEAISVLIQEANPEETRGFLVF